MGVADGSGPFRSSGSAGLADADGGGVGEAAGVVSVTDGAADGGTDGGADGTGRDSAPAGCTVQPAPSSTTAAAAHTARTPVPVEPCAMKTPRDIGEPGSRPASTGCGFPVATMPEPWTMGEGVRTNRRAGCAPGSSESPPALL
ncbi:hypothetical protein GCM10010405_40310 [Streptomyces macrosporus]|uniref:Uncharacterized protein n=1 Tax=Streptomyces macrosporus TaxID=44032 RepID=A0ABP5XCS8_9ACTN